MGAYAWREYVVSGERDAERVGGAAITHDLFPMLGIAPVLGRGFVAEEDAVGAQHVVLLSHELWRSRFGGDRRVLGRTSRLTGVEHTVVGVMPDSFAFPGRARLWTPLAPLAQAAPRDDRSVSVLARTAPDVPLEQVREEMRGIGRQIARENPATHAGWYTDVVSLRESITADYRGTYALVLASAVFVLLIVCANLECLMLARGVARAEEIAVRAALGANHGRLVRQLLTEAAVIAVLGATLGLLVAHWGVAAILRLYESVPYWLDVRVDARVIAFTVALGIATTLLFGLVPAARAVRPALNQILREGRRGVTSGRAGHRLHNGFVVLQVALTAALLSAAVMAVRTLLTVQRTDDLGWETRGLLQADANLLADTYADPARAAAYVERLLERLRAIPGVLGAGAYASDIPSIGTERGISVEGLAEDAGSRIDRGWGATPDYFANYVPFAQRPSRTLTFFVRVNGDPARVAPLLRAEARALDPDQPLEDVQTVERRYAERTRGPRVLAGLMTVFGVFAVLLAALGLYGLVSYSTRQRTREIGIRRALGAGARDVLELVARQALVLAGMGLALGVIAAFAVTRVAGVFTRTLGSPDLAVVAATALLLGGVALVASLAPARAATRVEPLSVLRAD